LWWGTGGKGWVTWRGVRWRKESDYACAGYYELSGEGHGVETHTVGIEIENFGARRHKEQQLRGYSLFVDGKGGGDDTCWSHSRPGGFGVCLTKGGKEKSDQRGTGKGETQQMSFIEGGGFLRGKGRRKGTSRFREVQVQA